MQQEAAALIENRIDDYRSVAPLGTVDTILALAEKLQGRTISHINSTLLGGGVAEILGCLVPLFRDVGVDARWEILKGNEEFFRITKSFHNALQGRPQVISDRMLKEYINQNMMHQDHLSLDTDIVLIHDPQPAALVEKRAGAAKWIWRCHIDVSRPQPMIWNFLKKYVSNYDAAIFSLPNFAQKLSIPQFLVFPSIDPLNDKNRELPDKEVSSIMDKLEVPRDKDMLLQVSRFDRFKDPLGVIEAYRVVKKYNDCRLVLAGSEATDDPEGPEVLASVQEASKGDPDIHILLLPPNSNLEINALQRSASIVFQKSVKEGFGLTVSEAMWKSKPVIGGSAPGIKAQIVPGVTGYTVRSVEGAAFWARYMLNNPEMMKKMGEDAKELVRSNFLITRHLLDYLAIMHTVLS